MKKKILFLVALFSINLINVSAAYYYETDDKEYALCTNSDDDCIKVEKNADGLTTGGAVVKYNDVQYNYSEEAQQRYNTSTFGKTRMYFYMSGDRFVLCKKVGSCQTFTREQLEKKSASISNKNRVDISPDEIYYYNSSYESGNSNSSNNNNSNTTLTDDTGYCTKLKAPLEFIGNIVLIFKIIIPIIIIIYGSLDFFRAVTGAKDDEIKKSGRALAFRVVAGVVIFLIPTLVSFVFSLISDFANIRGTFNACQKCVLNVRQCK